MNGVKKRGISGSSMKLFHYLFEEKNQKKLKGGAEEMAPTILNIYNVRKRGEGEGGRMKGKEEKGGDGEREEKRKGRGRGGTYS